VALFHDTPARRKITTSGRAPANFELEWGRGDDHHRRQDCVDSRQFPRDWLRDRAEVAECGVNRIGVHYLKNRMAAEDTASRVRECGVEPLLLQADIEFAKTTRFRSVDRKTVGGWSLAVP